MHPDCMRRSSAVKLTLLPVLATAAVAHIATAEPPTAAPSDPPTAEPSDPPTAEPSDPPTAVEIESEPVYPVLAPPGMTPTILELRCEDDPNWQLRPDCVDEDGFYYDGGVIRGGFGGYFYGGGVGG